MQTVFFIKTLKSNKKLRQYFKVLIKIFGDGGF